MGGRSGSSNGRTNRRGENTRTRSMLETMGLEQYNSFMEENLTASQRSRWQSAADAGDNRTILRLEQAAQRRRAQITNDNVSAEDLRRAPTGTTQTVYRNPNTTQTREYTKTEDGWWTAEYISQRRRQVERVSDERMAGMVNDYRKRRR